MMNAELRRRREAWESFARWEAHHPEPPRTFGELVAWMGTALRIAREAGNLPEPDLETTAARVAAVKRALATVPSRR